MEALVVTLLVLLFGGLLVWGAAVRGYDSRDGKDWRSCSDCPMGWRS